MIKFNSAYVDEDGDLHLEKNTGEGSGFRIHVASDCMVHLYSWPMYGGKECDEGYFNNIVDAIQEAKGWT